jgi:hypothetical protein
MRLGPLWNKLWQYLKPDVRRNGGRITKEWEEIGFQGTDPATDFVRPSFGPATYYQHPLTIISCGFFFNCRRERWECLAWRACLRFRETIQHQRNGRLLMPNSHWQSRELKWLD